MARTHARKIAAACVRVCVCACVRERGCRMLAAGPCMRSGFKEERRPDVVVSTEQPGLLTCCKLNEPWQIRPPIPRGIPNLRCIRLVRVPEYVGLDGVQACRNVMTSSEERTSAEAEGYRIERALMDCVGSP